MHFVTCYLLDGGILLVSYWCLIGILLVSYWYFIGIICPNAYENKIHASVALDCNVVLVIKFTFTVWQVRGALWLRPPFLGFEFCLQTSGRAPCLEKRSVCRPVTTQKETNTSMSRVRIELHITALSRATTGLPFVGAACCVFDQEFNICPEPSSTDGGVSWCL
jgi:hypothetical protein